MNLYKFKPQFDPNTGKPTLSKRILDSYVDDYNGNLIGKDEPVLYTLSIEYDHRSEPLWYCDRERSELEEQCGIDYADFAAFLNSPYAFTELSNAHGYVDTSFQLIEEWMMNVKNGLGPFRECGTVEESFRFARYRTLNRFLKENTYTLAQLGLTSPIPSDL